MKKLPLLLFEVSTIVWQTLLYMFAKKSFLTQVQGSN